MKDLATEIYRKIIYKFGDTKQIIVAIEELSELQKALCKWLRDDKSGIDDIVEEIADVRIMIEQLEMIFDCDLLVMEQRHKKLERTEKRYLK